MLPFAFYILKMSVCSAVLFGYYWFLLRNKIFHQYNRFYLLAIVGISMLLPFCQIDILREHTAPKTTAIALLQVVTSTDAYIDDVIVTQNRMSSFSIYDIMGYLYVVISLLFFIIFLQMLAKIFMLIKANSMVKIANVHFINTNAAKGTPFSFFKYIFWNNQIDPKTEIGHRIFKHELAHIQQLHSFDKVFINIVLIIFWLNPIYWLVRKELNMFHEFVADKQAVNDGDTSLFAAMILATTYLTQQNIIANHFFYTPIKRRLMMLTKNQHPKMNYFSRIIALPLLFLVFAAFTFKAKQQKNNTLTINPASIYTNIENTRLEKKGVGKSNTIYNGDTITVVIDAGHGGEDRGAMSENGIIEKDLTLQLIKQIKAQNTNKKIKIILTREIDIYNSVIEKAAFTNAQHPDMFISIHVDSKPRKAESGVQVYVPRDNFAHSKVSKAFGSVMIASFINQYGLPVPNVLKQRKASIYVLQNINCPSVLIEAGYLSNERDVAYLTSAEGQNEFAKNVLHAVNNFANNKATIKNNQIIAPTDTVLYKGKVVKKIDISINTKAVEGNQITGVTLTFEDNTKTTISYEEALRNGISFPEFDKKKEEKDAALIREKIMITNNNNEEIVYFNKGEIISKAQADKIMKEAISEITVLDVKAALEKFNVVTKGKLIVITNTANKKEKDQMIFTQSEQEAEFIGGKDAWGKYLRQYLNPNMASDEGWKPGTYNVMIRFVVEKDGSISDVVTENFANTKVANNCIAIIKNGPNWKPAMQNGHVVSAYKRQPITYVVLKD